MGLCFFSLDFLVAVIQRLHEEKNISKSFFYNRSGINVVINKLVDAELVCQNDDPVIQEKRYKGTGRHAKLYQLNRQYTSICVGDIYPLMTKMGRHEEHVCRLVANLPLYKLTATPAPKDIVSNPFYSASKMLDLLFFLSVTHYTQCDDMASVVSQYSHRRAILADLVKSGVVEVKRGCGYKLTKPLTDVPIKEVLPLMYTPSSRKQTYNAMIYYLRDKPIAILNRLATPQSK